MQGFFWQAERVIGCGHVSGLGEAACCDAAGRYGDTMAGSTTVLRPRGPQDESGFPNLDLIDPLSLLSNVLSHISPGSPRQAAASGIL